MRELRGIQVEPGGLLALDLARQLGWCYWSPTAIANWPRSMIEARAAINTGRWKPDGIHHGPATICQPAQPYGFLAVAYQTWLTRALDILSPAHVVRESPIVNIGWDKRSSQKRHSLDQEHRTWTLHIVTLLMCEHRPPMQDHHVDVNTARKYTAGTKKVSKEDVAAIFRVRGLDPRTLDVSDAMCVGDYGISLLYR